MADQATNLLAATTFMNAGADLASGHSEYQAMQFQQEQLEQNANAAIADSSREAYQQGRAGKRLEGDARAAQGASGGTTTDAGAIQQQESIRNQSENNVLTTLYGGQRRSEGYKKKAVAARSKKRMGAATAGNKGLATVIKGWPSIYESYKGNK